MLLPQIMSLPARHLTAPLLLSLTFAATPAHAQGDALEQPYDSGANPEPVPTAASPNRDAESVAVGAPASEPRTGVATAPEEPQRVSGIVSPVLPADERRAGPIRSRRRLALTGEVGWNGIAGFGPVLSYHVVPHFTTEFGVGLSLTGWKAGFRARYNLLTGNVTPFLGAGMMATSGLGTITGDFDDRDESKEEVTIRVRPSAFVQGVLGLDWTTRGGFTLVGCVGWAQVLNDNLDIVAGNPTRDERRAFDAVFRSGPVITVGTGYTFE